MEQIILNGITVNYDSQTLEVSISSDDEPQLFYAADQSTRGNGNICFRFLQTDGVLDCLVVSVNNIRLSAWNKEITKH